MNDDPTPRFGEIFLELYEGLPRQGPGNRASAAQALVLCRELPASPAIIDLGCGAGAQTLYVSELTGGTIVALDSLAPLLGRLQSAVTERGLSGCIRTVLGDMADPCQPLASFDLVWSEGALYNIGIERAARVCFGLLRPGGYLVFTDAVWRREAPPRDVADSFADYPTMGWARDVLATLEHGGFDVVGHFTLPDEAWWDDFYAPMEMRLAALRVKYAGDSEAELVLNRLAQEPEMHRRHGDFYAYEFFVARRPMQATDPRAERGAQSSSNCLSGVTWPSRE
jgi:SAM-dependent methyltransferase